MVSATNKMVFVGEVEIPEHVMQEFSAIVSVEEVPITGLKVNGEAGFANLQCVRASPVGGIV